MTHNTFYVAVEFRGYLLVCFVFTFDRHDNGGVVDHVATGSGHTSPANATRDRCMGRRRVKFSRRTTSVAGLRRQDEVTTTITTNGTARRLRIRAAYIVNTRRVCQQLLLLLRQQRRRLLYALISCVIGL